MKKGWILLIMIAALFLGHTGQVDAASNSPLNKTVWQPMGYDVVTFKTTEIKSNKVFGKVRNHEEANKLAITISKHKPIKYTVKNPYLKVQVWEMDSYGDNDFIGNFTYFPKTGKQKTFYFDNIRDFADGGNNQAEIFLVYTSNYTGSTMAQISFEKLLPAWP